MDEQVEAALTRRSQMLGEPGAALLDVAIDKWRSIMTPETEERVMVNGGRSEPCRPLLTSAAGDQHHRSRRRVNRINRVDENVAYGRLAIAASTSSMLAWVQG